MSNISMIKCPKCKAEYQNFLATQLRAELATEKDICEQLCDDIDAMRKRARKAEAELAAAKLTLDTFKIERELMKPIKANLKLCKADIELRKDYESYLQSTTKPMYSYNSWKKQQSQKGD